MKTTKKQHTKQWANLFANKIKSLLNLLASLVKCMKVFRTYTICEYEPGYAVQCTNKSQSAKTATLFGYNFFDGDPNYGSGEGVTVKNLLDDSMFGYEALMRSS